MLPSPPPVFDSDLLFFAIPKLIDQQGIELVLTVFHTLFFALNTSTSFSSFGEKSLGLAVVCGDSLLLGSFVSFPLDTNPRDGDGGGREDSGDGARRVPRVAVGGLVGCCRGISKGK